MTEPRPDALDEQWCAHLDARALGEDAPEPRLVADSALAEAWADELAFYEALAAEAAGHPDAAQPDEDRALIEQVLALDAARASEAEPASGIDDATDEADAPANDSSRGASGLRWGLALVAVAAAVVLSLVFLSPDLGLRASTGSWVAHEDRSRVTTGDALPLAVWLVAEDEACGEVEDASVCATAGSVVRIHRERGRGLAVELRRGSVSVRGTIDVHTPQGILEGSDDSRYDVRIDEGVVEVEVWEGSLRLVEDDAVQSLAGGASLRLGAPPVSPSSVEPAPEPTEPTEPAVPEPPESTSEPEPEPEPTTSESTTEAVEPPRPRRPAVEPEPPADPSEMLTRARTLGGKGDKRGAARAYAALIDAHPGSGEAQAARVSLGQLRLRSGRNKAALALFRRYLERGGSLAEEALWGEIQALDALGREAGLRKTVDELTRRFPRSVYRTRAEELVR